MRIVIDLQGAQSDSRTRGVGRYSLAFAQAIARNGGDHDVIIALNDAFPETVEPIRRAMRTLVSDDNIRVWSTPGPVHAADSANDTRRGRAELIYESFLASLEPDIVHVTSLFEGFGDDAVSSLGQLELGVATSITLYDLIPLHDPDRFLKPNPAWERLYRSKLEQLKKADLLLAISDFSACDARERLTAPRGRITNVSTACADMFRPLTISDAERAALFSRLGTDDRPFILTSGTIEPHKNLTRLFQAFAKLPPSVRKAHRIVLMGKVIDTQWPILDEMARKGGLSEDELLITGHVSDDDLIALYNLCDLMVFPSMDEGFGLPALEAMACGAPTLGSRAASVPEVVGREDALFDPLDVDDMARLIERGLTDKSFRATLKAHAPKQAKTFSWDQTGQRALCEMEAVISDRRTLRLAKPDPLVECVNALAKTGPQEAETVMLARSLAWNFPTPGRQRHLFVDVSELVQRDVRTGCQRVARSILLEWLNNPPGGIVVEPVYATLEAPGYRLARAYVARLLGAPVAGADDPIEYAAGDIFYGLDLQLQIIPAQERFLLEMKRRGVDVRFLVYDLLPVISPQHFALGTEAGFDRWLQTVSKFDGIIGISQASVDAFKAWQARHLENSDPTFRHHVAHLGADVENSAPTTGQPPGAGSVLAALERGESFLMVGTLEPRKGHAQALAAFETLWARGAEPNLIVVGRRGWNVDNLAQRLDKHRERGKRLFWLDDVSDEYLESLYSKASCLIAASYGEGFGLPLIEAARHGLPILARDIPVFREVAGDHAAWFDGSEPADLARAVESWLAADKHGTNPRSDDMPWITWAESAQRMALTLLGSKDAPSKQVRFEKVSGLRPLQKRILLLKLDHMDTSIYRPFSLRRRIVSAT